MIIIFPKYIHNRFSLCVIENFYGKYSQIVNIINKVFCPSLFCKVLVLLILSNLGFCVVPEISHKTRRLLLPNYWNFLKSELNNFSSILSPAIVIYTVLILLSLKLKMIYLLSETSTITYNTLAICVTWMRRPCQRSMANYNQFIGCLNKSLYNSHFLPFTLDIRGKEH